MPDRSRRATMCEDPGIEQKEKPSGASTDRDMEIAARLRAMELKGKENEHGRTEERSSLA